MTSERAPRSGRSIRLPGPPGGYSLAVAKTDAADEAPARLRITVTNDRGQATELDFASNADAQWFAERLILALRDHRQP